MKKYLLITSLLILLLLVGCSTKDRGQIKGADAAPDAVPDPVGTYAVNGFDPLGTEYGGTLTIQPGNAPGEFALQWILTGSIQEGAGRLEGNQLLATWRVVEAMGARSTGVTTYTITTLGELHGLRQVTGYPTPGTENAFPNQ